jgi:hypothetical protein
MVFVDEGERPWHDAQPKRAASPDHTVGVARTPVDVPKRAPIQRPEPPRVSASVSSLGCIAGLVRLALFALVVWYVGKWLLAIPEVSTLVSALRSGVYSDDQVNAAIDAVRTHVLQLVGISTASPHR